MVKTNICSIGGCGRKIHGRGWCDSHYRRWRIYGDPMLGQTRQGAVLEFLEEAKAYIGNECLIWPFYRDENGYARIGRGKIVHRIICEAMYGGPADGTSEVRHLCGNGNIGCVTPKHLIWGTSAENSSDMIGHGRSSRGQKHWRCKLTPSEVIEIRGLIGTKAHREIGDMFGVCGSTITAIKGRRAWAWL